MAECIDDNMPFTFFDLLARVIAAFTADFGRLGTLAVDDTRTWLGCSLLASPFFLAQGFVHCLPGAVVSPLGIMVVDALIGWIALGQFLPLTPRPQDIEDGIHHCSQV